MKKHLKLIGTMMTLAGLIAFSACSKEEEKPTPTDKTVKVTGVTLDKTTASIKVGETLTLTETIAPSNATNQAVTWASTATNVATVNNKGVVTAVAEGTTSITVTTTDGSFKASCAVTVIKDAPAPTSNLTIQLEGFSRWTAKYLVVSYSAGNGFVVQAAAGNTQTDFPLIVFRSGLEVTGSDRWYPQDNNSFRYFHEKTYTTEDKQTIIGDWCIGTYEGGTVSAGVTISSIDITNLVVSGGITGALVSTQEYLVDRSSSPTQKTITGTFINLSLQTTAKKSMLKSKIMPEATKITNSGSFIKGKK